MALSRITWRDVQQVADEGKRRESIRVELPATGQCVRGFWLVDAQAETVKV